MRLRPGLAKVLKSPSSIELRSRQEQVLDIPLAPGTKSLVGRADGIIADMLRMYPFYAVQGPPGTGKSTVVSRALRQYLTTEHGARVLVSAQSNDALDQLAVKVVDLLKPVLANQSILALRELARTKDRESLPAELRSLTAEGIADDLAGRIEKRVAAGFEGAAGKAEADLMQRWAGVARANLVELTERVRSSADVVFATCSVAGALADEIEDISDVFDWVIVEEAAKAWPTEIIMPLVRGVRWTLVGDHRQLGPHRAQDMSSFLNELANHEHEQVEMHYEARDDYEKFVRLFEGFFEQSGKDVVGAGKPPVDSLDTQFRMHPTIAAPFAHAFYGGIKSGPGTERAHGRTSPPYLTNAPLVWLDTSLHDDCRDEGAWYNLGEVALVQNLVAELRLDRDTDPSKLVVLTPYRQQVGKLEQSFLRDRVHTVHSFQGGEADVGIISLVRSTERGGDVRQNIGHTASPEVINVMLSRAQRLMVVVGNLLHFERHGGPDWASVIATFRDVGRIVDATTGEVIA